MFIYFPFFVFVWFVKLNNSFADLSYGSKSQQKAKRKKIFHSTKDYVRHLLTNIESQKNRRQHKNQNLDSASAEQTAFSISTAAVDRAEVTKKLLHKEAEGHYAMQELQLAAEEKPVWSEYVTNYTYAGLSSSHTPPFCDSAAAADSEGAHSVDLKMKGALILTRRRLCFLARDCSRNKSDEGKTKQRWSSRSSQQTPQSRQSLSPSALSSSVLPEQSSRSFSLFVSLAAASSVLAAEKQQQRPPGDLLVVFAVPVDQVVEVVVFDYSEVLCVLSIRNMDDILIEIPHRDGRHQLFL